MSNIIIVGFTTEGSTDVRFLESVIRRTFEDVAFECETEISVHDVLHISKKNQVFNDNLRLVAEEAKKSGVMVLCVHADADSENQDAALRYKFNPAMEAIVKTDDCCDIIVPIIPVRMTESWMLSDKDLFKSEIGTSKNNNDLEIARNPEEIADPKAVIEEAIRIATEDFPNRRNRVQISELYLPIGQKIDLNKLKALTSYNKFVDEVRTAFVKLNYMH